MSPAARHRRPELPAQPALLENFLGWSRITNQLYMWTYATNFRYHDLPSPNPESIGRNLRFYAEHGVKGAFEQGNSMTLSGEFSDLRNYVICRCLWNPWLQG